MASVQSNGHLPQEMGVAGFKSANHGAFHQMQHTTPFPTTPVGGQDGVPHKPNFHHKEPHSPAISVVSTHCGGSPTGGFIPQAYRSSSDRSSIDRSMSNMSHFDLAGTSSMTLMSALSAGQLEEASSEEQFVAKASVNTPVAHPKKKEAPVHMAKMKGERMPTRETGHRHHHCEKTQKIIDEAHHFGLCPHYAKLLDTAKEIGFANIQWPTNFTLFHLAAKKNNKKFIEWLVRNDFDDLHAIDDFGKKPVDYACAKKRDSVHAILEAMMMCVTAPDTAAEKKYQQIKAGTYVDPEKEKKKEIKKVNCMDAVLQSADIALGDVPDAKPSSMMSAYEAETVVPMEYKKCFKKLANGGWSAMDGQWPNNGQSVLHWAARQGKEELCHFLVLEYKADPHQEDGNGHDAMYHAKLKRHRKLAKKLLLKFKEPKAAKKGKK
jgi:ribosomal protein L21